MLRALVLIALLINTIPTAAQENADLEFLAADFLDHFKQALTAEGGLPTRCWWVQE